jgi:hypothetical protein
MNALKGGGGGGLAAGSKLTNAQSTYTGTYEDASSK